MEKPLELLRILTTREDWSDLTLWLYEECKVRNLEEDCPTWGALVSGMSRNLEGLTLWHKLLKLHDEDDADDEGPSELLLQPIEEYIFMYNEVNQVLSATLAKEIELAKDQYRLLKRDLASQYCNGRLFWGVYEVRYRNLLLSHESNVTDLINRYQNQCLHALKHIGYSLQQREENNNEIDNERK